MAINHHHYVKEYLMCTIIVAILHDLFDKKFTYTHDHTWAGTQIDRHPGWRGRRQGQDKNPLKWVRIFPCRQKIYDKIGYLRITHAPHVQQRTLYFLSYCAKGLAVESQLDSTLNIWLHIQGTYPLSIYVCPAYPDHWRVGMISRIK